MKSHEPIAVVGMSCRLPGANDIASLWQLLREGRCSIQEVPGDRFSVEDYYDSKAGTPGKVITREGGYLSDIRGFDAQFFRMSHREATAMDPQHRLLVETSWHAMEDAGIAPDFKTPRRAGVFVGTFTTDYRDRMLAADVDLDIYTEIGTTRSSAAGRVAHALNFDGPVVAVDAACASSLVAVHLACQSILNGESEIAIAAGANLILSPESTVSFSRSGMLSPRSRCHFGDASADGFVRSEGVASVVLKPLSRAIADGDRVYAVVRASAVTNDARHGSGLFMTPSREGQSVLLRRVWIETEMPVDRLVYIEAHGTGTRAGDPVECNAIADVLGAQRNNLKPLYLGSVKTNLGHTEGCAGIAGFIKTCLTLHHRHIPPSLHLQNPNPEIPWARGRFEVPQSGVDLDAGGSLMAGVNSFGISGTNAHVALETFEQGCVTKRPPSMGHALVLSAPNQEGLHALVDRYAKFLRDQPTVDLGDVGAGALTRRCQHSQRFVAVGESCEDIVDALSRFVSLTKQATTEDRKVVFVFPGQGGQWRGMARGLVRTERAFETKLNEIDEAFVRIESWSIRDALLGDEQWTSDIARLQPCLFAMQVSLAALWNSYGVKPYAVVGHSLGEVAAAHIAGALTLDDAVRVIATRSRLLARIRGHGAMLVVHLPASEVSSLLVGHEHRVALAVQNGRESCVLSGDPATLEQLSETLTSRGVYNARVDVNVASHSPQVEPLLGELRDALATCLPRSSEVTMYSTVDAKRRDGITLDANYWASNLRCSVRFFETIEQLLADGANTFIEVGTHPTLVHPMQQTFREQHSDAVALASLRRDDPSRIALLQSLSTLDALGLQINWRALYGTRPFIALPHYPFQHENFWWNEQTKRPHSVSLSRSNTPSILAHAAHPWIARSALIASQPGSQLWDVPLSLESIPSLADHCVLGSAVLPGAAYVELAYAVGCHALGTTQVVVENVVFQEVMVVHESSASTLQCFSETNDGENLTVRFDSLGANGASSSRSHAKASVRKSSEQDVSPEPSVEVASRFTGEDFYTKMQEAGVEYGPRYRVVRAAKRGDNVADVWMSIPDETLKESEKHPFHPAILDGCFQAAATVTLDPNPLSDPRTTLPLSVSRLVFLGRPSREMRCTTVMTSNGEDAVVNAWIRDASGALILVIEGLRVRRFEVRERQRANTTAWFHQENWNEIEPRATQQNVRVGVWQVFTDDTIYGSAIADAMLSQGRRCTVSSLADVPSVGKHTSEGIVIHVSCGTSHGDGTSVQTNVVQRSLAILDALRRISDTDSKTPVWLLTDGAWKVSDDDAVSLESAALVGLARVVRNERSGCSLHTADLPMGSTDVEFESLARCLVGSMQGEIAIRGARIYQHQILPMALSKGSASDTLSTPGTWLVTGGTGGIGMALTRWIARNGARHIALLSRSGARSQDIQDRIESLNAAGVVVRVFECDVANEASLAQCLTQIDSTMPPLVGVFHLAAVLADATLPQQDHTRFSTAMSPKVSAAWNLHRATMQRDLKAFVLFSSVAGVLGSPGQANYAAANTCIDALAVQRRSMGLPAVSIQWGTWADIGLAAARDDRGARLESRGLLPMSPNDALDAMGQCLNTSVPPVFGIYSIDWGRWVASFPSSARTSRLATMLTIAPTATDNADRSMDELASLAPKDRMNHVAMIVRNEIAGVLRAPLESVSPRYGLLQLGMDSLMTVELVGRIREKLRVEISPSRLLEATNMDAIATLLVERIERPASRASEILELRPTELALNTSISPQPVVGERGTDLFLTGATGFLGAHILRELLDLTQACVRCLVRASDTSAAMQRIVDTMTLYEIARPGDIERIVPVVGDLSQSRFGLAHEDFSALAATVGDIYHAGAWVNHLLPYSRLRATNVEGTREVLRLACTGTSHRVHYVSTLGVFPFSTDSTRARTYTEDSPLSTIAEPFFGGYAESKRVAEEWIVQARARGVYVNIYRPGAITGSTHAATAPTSDALWRIVRTITELGAAPLITRGPSMTPVDGVARAIVALSLTEQSKCGNFHLLHPESLTFGEVVNCLQNAGFHISNISASHWRRRCIETLTRESAMYPMLPRLQGIDLDRLDETPVHYNASQTWQLLPPEVRSLLACPSELVVKYIQRLQTQGFFPAPTTQRLRNSARPSSIAPSL
jgi:myxalamid-type polyketide synthase MxaD